MKLSELPGPADWTEFATDLDEIGSDGDNPNEMDDEMFSELVDNIREYGWVGGPILLKPAPADTDATPISKEEGDPEYLISDGEHRAKAAKDLGLVEVPAIVGDEWSEADRRLLRQRMNKVAGEHDQKRDALEFDWLAEHGKRDEVMDLLDARGESFDEYMDMIANRPRRPMDRDLDLDANVHYQDCIEGMQEHLEDDSVDMVFTSPPYNVELDPAESDWAGSPDTVAYEDNRDWEEYVGWIGEVCEELARVVKPDGDIFFNIQVDTREGDITPPSWVAEAMPIPWRSYIVWSKGILPPGAAGMQERGRFAQTWEPVLHFSEDPSPLAGSKNFAVWEVSPSNMEFEHDTGVHPAPFPVSLVEEAMTPTTQPGDVVMDPFMGSGTTAVAAILNERDYVGFELDEAGAYKPIIERRVRDAYRQVHSGVNQEDADEEGVADGD